MEREITKMKIEGSNELMLWQQKSQKMQMEHDHMLRLHEEQKEKIGKELIHILEELLRYQAHIDENLKELSDMATQSYEEAETKLQESQEQLNQVENLTIIESPSNMNL
jgi:SMC interacting uncharacterized protein involved in chromosome segregation